MVNRLLDFTLFNQAADTGGADRLAVDHHRLDDAGLDPVGRAQLSQLCGITGTVPPKMEIEPAAHPAGIQLLMQDLPHKRLRRHVPNRVKIRLNNLFHAQRGKRRRASVRGKQLPGVVFRQRPGRLGKGEDGRTGVLVPNRAGNDRPMAEMHPVEYAQRHGARDAGQFGKSRKRIGFRQHFHPCVSPLKSAGRP